MLRSADGTTTLTASADREVLVAGDADLAFIAIDLRDPSGILVTSEDRKVAVSVEVPVSCRRSEATGAGSFTVTVTADELEPVMLTLTADGRRTVVSVQDSATAAI